MNRTFLIAMTLILTLYTVPEIIEKDALLYILAGAISGVIASILKVFGCQELLLQFVFVVWFIVLVVNTVLCFRIERKVGKIVLCTFLFLNLYYIDFTFVGVSFDFVDDLSTRVFLIDVKLISSILLKTTTLVFVMSRTLFFHKRIP